MAIAVVGGFIAMDCITGIVKAIKNKNFSSSIMREGLFHKASCQTGRRRYGCKEKT